MTECIGGVREGDDEEGGRLFMESILVILVYVNESKFCDTIECLIYSTGTAQYRAM